MWSIVHSTFQYDLESVAQVVFAGWQCLASTGILDTWVQKEVIAKTTKDILSTTLK